MEWRMERGGGSDEENERERSWIKFGVDEDDGQ